MNSDNNTNQGDFESPLTRFVCEKPMNIEARTIGDHVRAEETGETFEHYNIIHGFVCLNKDQEDKKCENYEIRLCCVK